ncbi:MAG: hypothetical protein V7603_3036 [Micromonosporaceae bacterium]
MRRSAVAAIAALTLAILPATSAFGDPSPAAATKGKTVCQMTDANLSNVTGMATTATGYAVVRTGAQFVYLLDGRCRRKTSVKYSGQANSPQDVSVGADGTIWVADTGDADTANPRLRIALWKVPAGGARGTIYRFTYPNGSHYDAGTMVMSGNGLPVFVTRSTNGPAGIYTPSAALNPAGTAVPLKKVGEFTPQKTGTANFPLGALGNTIVTGGATSPDGRKVVLRTYSDAYEWTVANGDVAAAITGGKPQVTPLPDETTGEAITYTRDGQFFLTTANLKVDAAHPDAILRYTPRAAGSSTTQAGTGAAAAGPAGAAKGDTRNWWDKLSLEQIAYLVAAIGVIGLLMVVGGVIGIRRSRRRQRLAALTIRTGGRGAGSAQVPGMTPPERQPDPYGAPDSYPEPYEPYGNQYGGQYGDGYPPAQGYQPASGYGDDYDQPGPRRPPGDTYPGGGYQDDGYGGQPGPSYGGYPRTGDGRGVGRAAPPRPPAGRGHPPDGPGSYGAGGF